MVFVSLIAAAVLPLCDFATNALNVRIAAASQPLECLSRFSDYAANGGRDRFVPNPKFWLKGVDFSCVSPWNSAAGSLRAGTAISKRHVVFAKHFALPRGSRIVFVGNDGGICPVRIEATKPIEGTDIMIASLDYELTPNVRPAKILPSDYKAHIGRGKGFPVVTFNQNEKVFLTELSRIPDADAAWKQCTSRAFRDGKRAGFREEIVRGDSGNPAFLLVGDEAILLYCLLGSGCGNGPPLNLYRREIQAAMDELCPGYKLECFDFSKVGK